MSRQNQWLFETPSTQASSYYANLEYEAPLEHEWEISAGEEWEAFPSKRRVGQTGVIPGRNSRQAMPNQRRRVQSNQLRHPDLSRQATGTQARILIKTIDGFESDRYLLKRHQFEQLADLITLLRNNKKLLPKLELDFSGHTDNVGGNSPANFLLGERRAIEVEDFIKRQLKPHSPNLATFISASASKEPIAPNTTEKGRARNRIVDVFSNIPLKLSK